MTTPSIFFTTNLRPRYIDTTGWLEPPLMRLSSIDRSNDALNDTWVNCRAFSVERKANPNKIKPIIPALSLMARVYPNPSDGDFTLDYQLISNNGIVKVLDFTGRILFEQYIYSSNKSIRINLSNLGNGIYYWKVSDIVSNISLNGRITILK